MAPSFTVVLVDRLWQRVRRERVFGDVGERWKQRRLLPRLLEQHDACCVHRQHGQRRERAA
eukprot:6182061-Pleurochrysis_carterae.AAC.1